MVTHYPHRIASNEGLISSAGDAHGAADGYATRAFWWLRRTYCGLSGHDALVQFQRDRIFLRCASCGHESPGWELNGTAPPISVRGEARRPGLHRPHLVSERRIA
jgi:hypothetical protein